MKSRFLIAFAAVVALASVSAYAQTSMRVSVPFEFTVGRTVLPAGEYIVQGNTSLGGASLQTAHAGPGAYALAVPAVRNNAQDQPTLVFNHYGSSYFLVSAWWGASTQGLEFPRTKTEIEAAKTAGVRRPEHLTLLASR
jgi:hypothetical protein